MNDGALLTAIGEGDSTTLCELFERHAPWIAVRLRRVLPDHAVEDVMQETFIAAMLVALVGLFMAGWKRTRDRYVVAGEIVK